MNPERKLHITKRVRTGALITAALGFASAAAGGMGLSDNLPLFEGFEQHRMGDDHVQIVRLNFPIPKFNRAPMPDSSFLKEFGTLTVLLSLVVASETGAKILTVEKQMKELEEGEKETIVPHRRLASQDIRNNATVLAQLAEIKNLDKISGEKPPRGRRRGGN